MRLFILAILFTAASLKVNAQDIEDSTETTITDDATTAVAEKDADYYYGQSRSKPTANFQVKHAPVVMRRAFRVNSAKSSYDVYERALGFARLMDIAYHEDRKKMTVYVPVTWQYHGGFNECIEDMELNGQLVLEVKDTKTRISLTNITYKHHDRDDAGSKPVAKSDFFQKYPDCAPSKGKIELLYNCKDCQRSLNSLDKSLQSYFENVAGQYQERLKKY